MSGAFNFPSPTPSATVVDDDAKAIEAGGETMVSPTTATITSPTAVSSTPSFSYKQQTSRQVSEDEGSFTMMSPTGMSIPEISFILTL